MVDEFIERTLKVKEFLCSKLTSLGSSRCRSAASDSTKGIHEKVRQRKRKKENKSQAMKEKHERLLLSAVKVSSMIMPSGYSDRVSKGDFKMVIDEGLLQKDGLSDLKPRFHLRGLKFLVEKKSLQTLMILSK